MRVVCKDTIKCGFVSDYRRQNKPLKFKITAFGRIARALAGETEKIGGEISVLRKCFIKVAQKRQLQQCNCLIAALIWTLLVTPTVVHNIASQLYKKVFEKANA